MKIALILIGGFTLSVLMGFVIGMVLPEPFDLIVSFVSGCLLGWYIVAPIIIEELKL